MRMLSKIVAIALAASLQSAMADTLVLDFEDLTTTSLLNGTYKGVDISGSAWSARSTQCQGSISFNRGPGNCSALLIANNPTQGDSTDPQSLTIALSGGFVNAVSFAYAGKVEDIGLSVTVFDAAGKSLATLSPLSGDPCTNFAYCNWSDAGGSATTLTFSETASYITFTALTDNAVLLDDLRFTRATPATNPLPEPGGVALAFAALGALGWTRRRSAR